MSEILTQTGATARTSIVVIMQLALRVHPNCFAGCLITYLRYANDYGAGLAMHVI